MMWDRTSRGSALGAAHSWACRSMAVSLGTRAVLLGRRVEMPACLSACA